VFCGLRKKKKYQQIKFSQLKQQNVLGIFTVC